jgi:periplasmic protein CpxP/Spy
MNKDRFYQLVIFALLILNAGLLFMHFNKPPRPKRPGEIIIEKLKFDKNQIDQFEKFRNGHHDLIMANENEINILKTQLYQQLNASEDSLKLETLSKNIAELQKKAELINFKHFQDIRKICKTEQLPLFENLTGELSQIFGKKKEPRKNK